MADAESFVGAFTFCLFDDPSGDFKPELVSGFFFG
jgi:hypothetical protein